MTVGCPGVVKVVTFGLNGPGGLTVVSPQSVYITDYETITI